MPDEAASPPRASTVDVPPAMVVTTPTRAWRHRTLSGIGLTLLAVLGFASLDSCVKYLSGFLPMLVVVWVRYALQALIMGVWLAWRAGGRHFRVKHPRFQ